MILHLMLLDTELKAMAELLWALPSKCIDYQVWLHRRAC